MSDLERQYSTTTTMNQDENSELLTEASWLVAHARRFANTVIGWPLSLSSSSLRPLLGHHVAYLSASTQGSAISVLTRAYQLTGNEEFLSTAQGAVQALELDIFDGGVSTPLGHNGVFFEEIAVYPATHILKGHILALLGLYDYVSLTGESHIEALLQRGLNALDTVLDAFDVGYWTRTALLHGKLAPIDHHALHIALLQELAKRSNNSVYAAMSARWQRYQEHVLCRLRYHVRSCVHNLFDWLKLLRLRSHEHNSPWIASQTTCTPYQVCVPITAFPVPGGMRSVLAGVTQVMAGHWHMTYFTHHKGADNKGLTIRTFGTKFASPWHFPHLWLYSISGLVKLAHMLYRDTSYRFVLPQDGVFTGAFAAVAGKLAGMHVVCMDHGNITWLDNSLLHTERMKAIQAYPKIQRILARLYFAAYSGSLRLMARIATHCTDVFLVAGDEVNEAYCHQLNVPTWRIIRYAYTVDVPRFTPPDKESRVRMRGTQGLMEDAIVVSLINRLAPEKGLHFALEGIAHAMAALPLHVRTRLKVLIAGDGPLRPQLEADIRRYGLETTCILWGTASPEDVVMLLHISDIFLYSGTRGTNYSMAVLEAMAAGCAVIASASPLSNVELLARERGIAIAPGNALTIGEALTRLCSDVVLCQQMGRVAREYVATHHTSAMLERALLRASFFAPSRLEL